MNDTTALPLPQKKGLIEEQTIRSPQGPSRQGVGHYWLGKTLGKGSSGCVKLGIHKMTGEKVAIKIIPKSRLIDNDYTQKAVKREIAIMKLIKHPNIISLIDVIDLSDSSNLYLIMEYVQGGELFEYLVSQGKLSEREARKYFQQIITTLDYCHRHLICHRDLKPENLLIDAEKNIKIADFGMASLQPPGSLLETSCGSPHYASPEVVNASGVAYDGPTSDIWSCGIILYVMLSGRLPFDYEDIRKLLKKMKQVQSHPWFTVDTLPNATVLPDPPTALEIGRPVDNASEVDDRILETLKALWTDLSTNQILDALLSSDYNMQKVTYALLQRHSSAYWLTERDTDAHSAVSPHKQHRRPITFCGFSNNKEPLPGLEEMVIRFYEQDNFMSPITSEIHDHYTYSQPSASSLIHTPMTSVTENKDEPSDHITPLIPDSPLLLDYNKDFNTHVINSRQPNIPWRFISKNKRKQTNMCQHDAKPQQHTMFHQLHVLTQSQQHMSASHILSPKIVSIDHHNCNDDVFSSTAERDHPITAKLHPQIASKLTKILHLQPKNKVNPGKITASCPTSPARQIPMLRQKTTKQKTSFRWNDSAQAALIPLLPNFDSLATRETYLYQLSSSKRKKLMTYRTNINHSKWSSWLPNLFHFKQPKMYSLEYEANNEKEAIENLSNILEKYMDGFIIERKESDGRVYRRGEMKLTEDIYRQVQTAAAPCSENATLIQRLREQLRYYAVADIAGRPFLITKNDKVIVNRLKDVKVGDVLKLDKVRELGSKDYSLKGTPYVPEHIFDINATVIEHTKSKLIRIVKKKRRKNYKRTIEHKQTHTVLRISKVDVL
ncbi:hypothetical protein G6F26_001921 [Rhizopus arrhizus]|uniref:Protein kinase domain-containing protein n=1 Tax=Rhizopus oryzae TaxID=64495 RepID=A0A9P7BQA1_RHIOR|nr:hypothetical protein G6F23_003789 [Rhizopus arrhizus]KAG0850955.1 hypothetical protein G6F17_009430 [Rhizopus arrhizus]KAG0877263.1 hypothetical protein G6F16_001756 [Rhizopus arrhizus]KAG0893831.1 hypothetical protein G6F34_009644 [Rhizopus arrhizus]KAG0934973.1 hypothetical protein G6F30_009564 [Rhizopus arrhizus]